jgi:hypothetical protein
VLVGLAFALPAWNNLLLAGACINAACLLMYPFVNESARWLLTQGRDAEATIIIRQLSRANSTQMPLKRVVSSRWSAATAIVDDDEGLSCKDVAVAAAVAAEEGKEPDYSCKDLEAAAAIVDDDQGDLEGLSCKDMVAAAAAAAAEEGRGPDCSCHDSSSSSSSSSPPDHSLGVWQVLRERPLLFRFLVLLLNWFALYLSYCGITVSSGGLPESV